MTKNNDKSQHIYLALGAIFGVYFLLLLLQSAFFETRFGLDTQIAGVDVSLKDKKSAVLALDKAWSKYKNEQITLDGESYKVTGLATGIETEKSIDQALAKQKESYLLLGFLWRAKNEAKVSLNETRLSWILSQKYDKYATSPINARIDLSKSDNVILDIPGQRVLLPESKEQIVSDLGNLKAETSLVKKSLPAALTASEAATMIGQAKAVTAEPIYLVSERGNFTVSREQLVSWLEIGRLNPKTLILADYIVPESDDYSFFSQKKVSSWLDGLAEKIDQTPVNARLRFQNGLLGVATPAVIGYSLDKADLLTRIENIGTNDRSINLKVETIKPEVREDNLETLGLKELVSTGWSDFTGSPANRRHNVATGASKFDGAIIRPGEEFSFNKVLGPVESYTGYLPELVILENKTIPQYGGGLCQVSSTAFRAALNAGFPILERTKHAYPVVYYRPYGVDATIYLPKPDLVFVNDSGHYILIQTRIEGTRLYFDFFGTKPTSTAKFAGNANGAGAVNPVESVNPAIYDAGARGRGSFTATFYRFVYDGAGKLTRTDTFTSKYDSPDKYPH